MSCDLLQRGHRPAQDTSHTMTIVTRRTRTTWSQKLPAQDDDHHSHRTWTLSMVSCLQHHDVLHAGLGEQTVGWGCCQAALERTHPHLRRGLDFQRKIATDDERVADAVRFTLYMHRRDSPYRHTYDGPRHFLFQHVFFPHSVLLLSERLVACILLYHMGWAVFCSKTNTHTHTR